MKPQRFGRYELLEQMGKGGMATILLARLVGPSDFQKHLVIKRIHDHLTTDDETINRFLDEARLAARIHHPNVVQLFEFDQHKGTYYIAMEYVHGENLADLYNHVRKETGSGYHWGHAARVIAEAAAGLHAAHELVGGDGESLRIVHRDVSPQNIMITYDGHVKVADFGIAQAVGRHHNTVDGTVMGKVAYMSPEQCRGEPLDRRTDVFALGIVLYEMVCLRRLFRAQSDQETMRRVLQCDFTPPRQARPDLPVGLEQILLRALAVRPEDRYQTAAELQYAIDGFLAAERAMITASSLSALMAVVFQTEKLNKDRRIQKIYSQTFMEPPKARSQPTPQAGAPPQATAPVPSGAPRATPSAPTVNDGWDEAAAGTVRDDAPPPMARPERRERTLRGFDTPGEEPVEGADGWDDQAPTTIDVAQPDAPPVDPSQPLVWPPDARAQSSHTQPVKPGPARSVKNTGPTVELGPAQAPKAAAPVPSVAPEVRGAVQATSSPEPEGAPDMSTVERWPGNHHSGEIGAIHGRGVGVKDPGVSKGAPKGRSTQSIIAEVSRRSTIQMVLIGVGVAVLLGIFIGVTLTYLGNRGRSGAKKKGAAPAAAKKDIVSLTFKLSPPQAKLFIDGKEMPASGKGGERVVQVPWQETPLLVTVAAYGYVPKKRRVMPEKDQTLDIALEPQKVNTSRLAPMGVQPTRPRPRRAPRRRTVAPARSDMKRSVDFKDPFGHSIPAPRRVMRRKTVGLETLKPDF